MLHRNLTVSAILLALLGVHSLAACQTLVNSPNEVNATPIVSDAPQLLLTIDSERLQLSAAPLDSLPVEIGIFFTVDAAWQSDAGTEAGALNTVRKAVAAANPIYAQCGLHFAVETVQIIALPERLMVIDGNQPGSWGGHPPEDVENPDDFIYAKNERLTAETRELFTYGKQYALPNTISIFVGLREILYYIGDQQLIAGGLSFAPDIYHHADDYPFRNAILFIGVYGDGSAGVSNTAKDGDLSLLDGGGIAHEVGHMLLNTGTHETEPRNLMSEGVEPGFELNTDQCQRMRENNQRIFGEMPVSDPRQQLN